jgi:hypothetical protein
LGYVPEKEHPALPGNVRFDRPNDCGGIVSEFDKWRRRREVGHIEKNIEEETKQFHDMRKWMDDEYGSLVAPPVGSLLHG